MVLLLLKQQCDEPAISTLSQLELQPHIVREVQRRLRLGGSRLTVTDDWRRTALKIYASQLGLSILRPDENLGSMYRCQVRSTSHSLSWTVLGSDGVDTINCAHRRRPLSVMLWNKAKLTPSVNSSHTTCSKSHKCCLFHVDHACATGLVCSHSICHTNRLGYLCKTH